MTILGSRTLTPAEDPAGEWDILDSGTSLYRPTGGFGLPDSESPYRSAWRARIKPLEFHSFQELIADLKPDSVQFPLAIQGCLADSVFYDSTRTDSFDQTVSRIFVQGDSVVVSITESRYKTAAFRRYVFGLDSGLLTLERDHSAFMGGSQTVTMVRK